MLNIGLDYHDCPRFYNNKYRIIVFYDNNNQCSGVESCLQKWHGYNIQIIFVDINNIIGDAIDKRLIKSLCYQIIQNWIDKIYIIPQSRKIRQSIRNTFIVTSLEVFDEPIGEVHIQLYSKIVELVYRNSFRNG